MAASLLLVLVFSLVAVQAQWTFQGAYQLGVPVARPWCHLAFGGVCRFGCRPWEQFQSRGLCLRGGTCCTRSRALPVTPAPPYPQPPANVCGMYGGTCSPSCSRGRLTVNNASPCPAGYTCCLPPSYPNPSPCASLGGFCTSSCIGSLLQQGACPAGQQCCRGGTGNACTSQGGECTSYCSQGGSPLSVPFQTCPSSQVCCRQSSSSCVDAGGTCKNGCSYIEAFLPGMAGCFSNQVCCRASTTTNTCTSAGGSCNSSCRYGVLENTVGACPISLTCCRQNPVVAACGTSGGRCDYTCSAGEVNVPSGSCPVNQRCCRQTSTTCLATGGTCRGSCYQGESVLYGGTCLGGQVCCSQSQRDSCTRNGGVCRGYCFAGESVGAAGQTCFNNQVCCKPMNPTCPASGGSCRNTCNYGEAVSTTDTCSYGQQCCRAQQASTCPQQGGTCRGSCFAGEGVSSSGGSCPSNMLCCKRTQTNPTCLAYGGACRSGCAFGENVNTAGTCSYGQQCCTIRRQSLTCPMTGGACKTSCSQGESVSTTGGTCLAGQVCCRSIVNPSPCTSTGGTCRYGCQNGESQSYSGVCGTGQVCCRRGGTSSFCAAYNGTCSTASCLYGQATDPDACPQGLRCCLQLTQISSLPRKRCGRAVFSTRIVNAFGVASCGQWPWMVSLRLKSSDRHLCAGVLVSNDTVLTIRDCVYKVASHDLEAVVGEFDTAREDASEQRVPVSVSYFAPQPWDMRYVGQLAMVKLSRQLPFSSCVTPACLASSTPSPGSRLHVAGWGRNNFGSTSLQAGQVTLMDTAQCRSLSSLPIDPDVICSQPPVGSGDSQPCQHDEGGMVMMEKGGKYLLMGLILPSECPDQNKPSLFLDVTKYLDWILRRY